MRITIIALGSRGDVQLFAALGGGLVRAGHAVRLVTDRAFAGLAASQGLELAPTEGDVRALFSGESGHAVFERGRNPLTLARAMVRMSKAYALRWTEDCLAACDDAEAVITTGISFYVGAPVAKRLGLPLVQAYAAPFTPTRAFPSAVMPPPRRPLPSFVYLAQHYLALHIFWQAFRPAANAIHRRLGLPPLSLRGPFAKIRREGWPVLYGFSPLVLPKPADWPDSITVTGYWFLDRPAGWQPPPELVRFLDAGPPPVYVGFGSMATRDPQATAALVLEALRRTGRRAVLARGWGGLAAGDLPEGVRMIDEVPHDWLLPRMAAAVHHGGAGTTAAGLRAGIPAVVVPFLGDQPFWAWRLEQLGVAPLALPRTRLTVDRLAEAIDRAVTDPEMRRRAADLGERLRAEEGIGRAVAAFEAAVRR